LAKEGKLVDDQQIMDEVGENFKETVLHVACLYSNTPVALHIAQKYPELIFQQQKGIHEGTIFSFYIFQRKHERLTSQL